MAFSDKLNGCLSRRLSLLGIMGMRVDKPSTDTTGLKVSSLVELTERGTNEAVCSRGTEASLSGSKRMRDKCMPLKILDR